MSSYMHRAQRWYGGQLLSRRKVKFDQAYRNDDPYLEADLEPSRRIPATTWLHIDKMINGVFKSDHDKGISPPITSELDWSCANWPHFTLQKGLGTCPICIIWSGRCSRGDSISSLLYLACSIVGSTVEIGGFRGCLRLMDSALWDLVG